MTPQNLSPPLKTPAERSDLVQFMRFVAAALVLVTHATYYFHERVSSDLPVWYVGEVGVPLFFVISGLVMILSSAALPLRPAGAQVFMRRRLLRVVPLYWLATLIKVVVALLVPAVVLHNHFDPVFAIKSFLFIPTFNGEGEVRPIHGVGWTLLHEMFFYVSFATVMALGGRPLLWVSGLIVALCGVGVAVVVDSAWFVVMTHPVNLCFVVGMGVGWAILNAAAVRAAGALVVLALIAWGAGGQGASVQADSAVALLLPKPAVLLVAAMFVLLYRWRMPRAARWPIALGDSSYALYLFHPFFTPPILLVAHRLMPNTPALVQISLAVLLVLALSHAVHLWVEQPLVKRAQKLWRA